MESFLPPEDLAQIFKKNKTVFALAGFDQSRGVYFLGYSRGVLSALNLLDEANRSENPPSWYLKIWKEKIEGLINFR